MDTRNAAVPAISGTTTAIAAPPRCEPVGRKPGTDADLEQHLHVHSHTQPHGDSWSGEKPDGGSPVRHIATTPEDNQYAEKGQRRSDTETQTVKHREQTSKDRETLLTESAHAHSAKGRVNRRSEFFG